MIRFASPIRVLLLAILALMIAVPSYAQISVGVSIRLGPPVLPVYAQPVCPAPGYIWMPGYWAYGPDGYYWVPGAWVEPPAVGLLWTPGYWGWSEGFYFWHAGYWGPHVGFYGGINYGFGYTGVGFYGGYWRGGVYNYNRSVTNVNVTNVTNVYNTTVINNNTTVNKVSYNGGPGGAAAQPNAAEQAAARERHIAPTATQTQHQQSAGGNRALLASANHGQPPIAASPKAGVFSGPNVVAASKTNATQSKANSGPTGGNNGFKPFSANAVKGPNGGNVNGGNKNNVTATDPRFNGKTVANTNNAFKPGNSSGNANARFNDNGNGSANNTFKPVNSTAKLKQNYTQANGRGPSQPRGGHPPSSAHHNPPPPHNNRQGKEQR